MDPLTIIIVVIIVLLLLGSFGGRNYLPSNGGSVLYAICVVLVLFLVLRLFHVV